MKGSSNIGSSRSRRWSFGFSAIIHAALPISDAVDSPAALNNVSMTASAGTRSSSPDPQRAARSAISPPPDPAPAAPLPAERALMLTFDAERAPVRTLGE